MLRLYLMTIAPSQHALPILRPPAQVNNCLFFRVVVVTVPKLKSVPLIELFPQYLYI